MPTLPCLFRVPRTLRLLAAAAGLGLTGSGFAQTAVQPGAAPTQLSPFKVGAEDTLRVQPSTALLNQYLLEQHGVGQLQDVTGIAPNLAIINSDSRGFGDVLALRGMANTIFFSAPAVALFVDDVPGGSVSSYASSLLNIESFTVQSGPQSTSYGRNAAAGAIDIRTRLPGGRHQGKITADYGSFSAVALNAAFDGPLAPTAAYSLALGYAGRDGYLDNTFLKRHADDRRSFFGRGYLYFKPDPTLSLRVGALVENVNDDAARLSSLASADPFKVASDLNGETSLDRHQYSFQLRKKLSGLGSIVATTSWQKYDLDPAITDLDLNPFPAATSRVTQLEKTWTQEVRVETDKTADGAQARLGLFFFDSTTDSDAVRSFIVPPSAFVPPNFVQTERTVYTIGQRNFALFGRAEQPLAPGLTAEFGARLEHTTADIDRTKAASNNLNFPMPPEPRLQRNRREQDFSVTGGLTRVISPSLSVHVRTSLAHRPPGYSGFTASPALAAFKSERTWSNEAGLTFGAPTSRFGGALAAYWNTSNDYQFERTVPGSTDYVVVNATEVRARGLEARLMWQATDRVWWDFQAGYSDATFRNHRTAAGLSAKGRHVPFIPTGTLRTGLTVDLGGGFAANASYGLIGRTYYDESNTAAVTQPNYGLINAQLRYRRGPWAATVYGLNLADKQHYQFINPEIFAGSPGAPRRYGVQVSYEY